MNWNILQDGLCPKIECGKKLVMGLLDEVYGCSKCDFKISKEKFEKIAYGTRIGAFIRRNDDGDNMAELNNLGHELVAEDFSDSPFKK